jgi:hypothetical protein
VRELVERFAERFKVDIGEQGAESGEIFSLHGMGKWLNGDFQVISNTIPKGFQTVNTERGNLCTKFIQPIFTNPFK